MASSINKVIIVGNLGRDPEVRNTAGGQSVANFSVATSEQWADKQSGEKKEKTEWHRIVVWGKVAELCGQYLAKGRKVYIEGRLHGAARNQPHHSNRARRRKGVRVRGVLDLQGERLEACPCAQGRPRRGGCLGKAES